jgi:hypothetical protein
MQFSSGVAAAIFIPGLSALTFINGYYSTNYPGNIPGNISSIVQFYFRSPACSDQRYFPVDGIRPKTIYRFGSQHYMPSNSVPTMLTVRSSLFTNPETGQLQCNDIPEEASILYYLVPAEEVELPFTTPVVLPLRFVAE